MEFFLTEFEQSGLTLYFRGARWGYAVLNAAHIFAIALLVGSTTPLNLRLLGVWSSIDQKVIVRVLVPVAVTGLVLAVSTGALLFSTRAVSYAELTVFRIKLTLISIGTLSALLAHWRFGRHLELATTSQGFRIGLISLTCWISALLSGRFIAFFQ